MQRTVKIIVFIIAVGLIAGYWNFAEAVSAKVEDLCYVEGEDENVLIGEGLVVGLQGTGDKDKQTATALGHYLKRAGFAMDINDIKPKNVAMVYITATVRPYTTKGQRVTVTVSSFLSASSLKHGTLIVAPLYGPHHGKSYDDVYALATGTILVDDPTQPTKGTIISGGLMVKNIKSSFYNKDSRIIRLILKSPHPQTAADMVDYINAEVPELYGVEPNIARAINPAVVEVKIPESVPEKEKLKFHSRVLSVITPTTEKAVVYINTRSGIIVATQSVRVSLAGISLKGVGIKIAPNVTQKMDTVRSQGINDLITTFNRMGLGTDDIIKVLKALHRTDQLKAKLIIDDDQEP